MKTYRVGILGTENSHATAFAECFNLPDENGNLRYPDFHVTALYALEKAPSEAIVEKCGNDIKICDSIEEMIGLVDCVMVTARHGKFHLPFARPFIERGMPAFIDKPFTISKEDAVTLLEIAKENNAPLSGGSGCKYSDDLLALRDELADGKYGKVTSAVMNFPVFMDSEYGGFYFYASHLVEMTVQLFGQDIKNVTAFNKNGCVTAIAEYPEFNMILNFPHNHEHYATVYCENKVLIREIGIDNIMKAEVDHFVHTVKTGEQPQTAEELILPVHIMNAIERSLISGKTEAVTY